MYVSNTAGAGGPSYQVPRSLRIRSAASAYLYRTFQTATTQNVYTLSMWVKRGVLGTNQYLFFVPGISNGLRFDAADTLSVLLNGAAAASSAVFRDTAAWYHIVYSQNGAAYVVSVNGVTVLSGAFASPTFNTATEHRIAGSGSDVYIADMYFVDGQALPPSSFGRTDPTWGAWTATKYLGTYGVNGFYLPFTNNASVGALGYDYSTGGYFGTPTAAFPTTTDPSWASVQFLQQSGLTDDRGLRTITNTGGVTTTTGPLTGVAALNFSSPSVGMFVSAGATLFAAGTDFTFEFWLYLSGGTYLLGWGNSHYISITGNSIAWVNGPGSGVVLALNTWSHVSIVRSSGVVWWFVDGAPQFAPTANSAAHGESRALASPLNIGNTYQGGAFGLVGKIAGIRSTVGVARYPQFLNNWGSSSISLTAGVTYDSMYDVPLGAGSATGNGLGNYATLNAVQTGRSTLSNCNLTASGTTDLPTIVPTSGNWYFEIGGAAKVWSPAASPVPTSAFPNSAPSDPYFANVAVLLHMDSNFNDSSSNSVSVSVNGTAAISSAQSMFGGSSGFFDSGHTGYIAVNNTANTVWPSGTPFTIEFWIYPVSTANPSIFYHGTISNDIIQYTNTGALSATLGGATVNTTATLTFNAWNYVSYSRDTSNVLTVGINGVLRAPLAWAFTVGSSTGVTYWGSDPLSGSGFRFDGYLDDIRITNGVGRPVNPSIFPAAAGDYNFGQRPLSNTITSGYKLLHTGNLPAPAIQKPNKVFDAVTYAGVVAPVVPTAQYPDSSPSDPYFANVTALLHGEGSFTDSSPLALTYTVAGAATTSTAQKKFGTASIYSPGPNTQVTSPFSPSIALGSGDYSVEMWVYFTSASGTQYFFEIADAASTQYMWLQYGPTANTLSGLLAGASIPGTVVSLNTWTHVAIIRSSGRGLVYVNGTLVFNVAEAINYTTNMHVSLGGAPVVSGNASGVSSIYIDDFRLTKGVARLSTLKVTNPGAFQPDLVWVKNRSATISNKLTDSVRGVTKAFASDAALAETTDAGGVVSINSDGFTVGANSSYNANSNAFVAWLWAKGPTKGFDIVTYAGNSAAGTVVTHSLGVAPSLLIVRNRTSSASTFVWNSGLTGAQTQYLEGSNNATTDTTAWNSTVPASTLFTLGNSLGTNTSGSNYVAYLFAAIPGFSQFGTYAGNNLADGPFVYLGFRARFVMIKSLSGTNSYWDIYDGARNPLNVANLLLDAGLSNLESVATTTVDITSTGFKLRAAGGTANAVSSTYFYAAFAENPFKYSLAR